MTLKDLLMITDETINIMAVRRFPGQDRVALTITDKLLATDGALSDTYLNSEVTSIATGTDGSLCIRVDYTVED